MSEQIPGLGEPHLWIFFRLGYRVGYLKIPVKKLYTCL
jgi:hypothetical protein